MNKIKQMILKVKGLKEEDIAYIIEDGQETEIMIQLNGSNFSGRIPKNMSQITKEDVEQVDYQWS